jgi:hypothetical protein
VHLVGFIIRILYEIFLLKILRLTITIRNGLIKNDHNLNRNTWIAGREVNVESPGTQIKMLVTKLKKMGKSDAEISRTKLTLKVVRHF